MKSRIVHTKIWTDGWFSELAVDEKFLFLYLITNEYCNVLDIYELPMSVAVYQIGISKERINEIKAKFQADGKIDCIEDYVAMNNGYKYQFYKGAKNNYAKLRIIHEMSDRVIAHYHTPISVTLSQIDKECDVFDVSDRNLINLLHRVKERFNTIKITLSSYLYPDTHKNTEIIKPEIQNTEIKKVISVLNSSDAEQIADAFDDYQKGKYEN